MAYHFQIECAGSSVVVGGKITLAVPADSLYWNGGAQPYYFPADQIKCWQTGNVQSNPTQFLQSATEGLPPPNPDPEMNNAPLPTPGQRQAVILADNNLTAQQQIANQISVAMDFGIGAVLLFMLVIGYKFGANTANRATGRGGDL